MKLIFTNQYTELLLLANGLALLLFYAASQKKKQRAMKFGNYETLQKVAGDNFLSSSRVILAVKMLALTTLIIGISSPVLQQEVPSTGSDYVVAIDTSSSMLATDLEPSRLQSAKTVSNEFVGRLSNSTEIGAVSFSGQINNKTDLKTNKNSVKIFISNLEVGSYAGTAIGDAVYNSVTLLLNSRENRTVILITDGINNRGRPINESIEYANSRNVRVNTIGIGKSFENSSSTGNQSEIGYPNLDSDKLREISRRTGGNYTTVTSEQQLENALLELEKSTVRTDFSDELILLALLLFLGEWALGTTRYDILP